MTLKEFKQYIIPGTLILIGIILICLIGYGICVISPLLFNWICIIIALVAAALTLGIAYDIFMGN